jgi:hypothetical protein
MYAWSKDKVGCDAGELCSMQALGINAIPQVCEATAGTGGKTVLASA